MTEPTTTATPTPTDELVNADEVTVATLEAEQADLALRIRDAASDEERTRALLDWQSISAKIQAASVGELINQQAAQAKARKQVAERLRKERALRLEAVKTLRTVHGAEADLIKGASHQLGDFVETLTKIVKGREAARNEASRMPDGHYLRKRRYLASVEQLVGALLVQAVETSGDTSFALESVFDLSAARKAVNSKTAQQISDAHLGIPENAEAEFTPTNNEEENN